MAATASQYISVSRRTDVPRFFAGLFLDAWQRGSITYDGGYGRSYTVSLAACDVRGYIFWSKDFAPLLADPRFAELLASNNAVFHFTLNDCAELEPGVAPLADRLATMARLCELVGPERVAWRYDPLCRYGDARGRPVTNAAGFFRLLPQVAALGIERCHFSFMTAYAKVRNRGVRFLPFAPAEKAAIATAMLEAAAGQGLALLNCCNPELSELVPALPRAGCVDDDWLARTDRFGRHRPLAAKPTRPGCLCRASRDVGSYAWRCPHGCRYCYANPVPASRGENVLES